MSVPMTLSDLAKRDAKGSFFPVDACCARLYRLTSNDQTTKFGTVTHVRRVGLLLDTYAPSQGAGLQRP